MTLSRRMLVARSGWRCSEAGPLSGRRDSSCAGDRVCAITLADHEVRELSLCHPHRLGTVLCQPGPQLRCVKRRADTVGVFLDWEDLAGTGSESPRARVSPSKKTRGMWTSATTGGRTAQATAHPDGQSDHAPWLVSLHPVGRRGASGILWTWGSAPGSAVGMPEPAKQPRTAKTGELFGSKK